MRTPLLISLLTISLFAVSACDILDADDEPSQDETAEETTEDNDPADDDPKAQIIAVLLEVDDALRSGDVDEIREYAPLPPHMEDVADDDMIKELAEMHADKFDPFTDDMLRSDATEWDLEDDTAIVTISAMRGDGVTMSNTNYLIREDDQWVPTTHAAVIKARADVLDDPDEVLEAELTTDEAFDHYLLKAYAGIGIEARLEFNGAEIATFDDPSDSERTSENLTGKFNDVLRRGDKNKLDLIVTQLDDNVSQPLMGIDDVIYVTLHGVGTEDAHTPREDNRILSLSWGDADSEKKIVRWTFELN